MATHLNAFASPSTFGRKPEPAPALQAALQASLQAGEAILANSRDTGAFHQGTVAAVHTGPAYDIQYRTHRVNGADTETGMPPTHVKRLVAHTDAQSLAVGVRVIVNSQNNGVYQQGKITTVGAFGTFDVEYNTHTINGGKTETGIPITHLQLQDTPSGGSNYAPKPPAYNTFAFPGQRAPTPLAPSAPTAPKTLANTPTPHTPFTSVPDDPTVLRCPKHHRMHLTTDTSGAYANGWCCDMCASKPSMYAARYCCKKCTTDYCCSCAGAMIESAVEESKGGGKGKGGKPVHTHIAMLIDRSGSMQSMGSEVASGVNAYLDEQRKFCREDSATTNVTLATFDNKYSVVYNQAYLPTMPRITDSDVQPRGGTALYDAIGRVLTDTERAIGHGDHLDKVIVFILTDGHENASQEYQRASIQRMIAKYKRAPYNWEFFFAGANQDAITTGGALGLARDDCITFGNTPQKMRAAFGASSAQAVQCQRGGTKAFTPMQRGFCG